MSFTLLWITLLMALQAVNITNSQDNACSTGDFCIYQCHCNNACQGRTDGQCPINAKCDKGWFGLRCQYKDLVTESNAKIVLEPTQTSSNWLTDRDDSTCNLNQNLQSVTVSWENELPLTWLRIVMSDTTQISSTKVYYNLTNGFQECIQLKWSKLNQNTVDIRCEENVRMKNLKIVGTLTSLCSYYISGGRNIAYKQNASQSTNFMGYQLYVASLAVDGNTDSDLESSQSCSHTNFGDRAPRFDLTFNRAYVIKQFILYNRNAVQERLQGFRLQTLDEKNNIVDNFKDTLSPQDIYYINSNTSNSIVHLSIYETSKNGPFVILCEVQALGECPLGKWSLPCTQSCHSACPTSCNRDDGSCNTVCAGYSNPPECTAPCTTTKWGINCTNNCNEGCVDTSCDSKTGLCDKGCLGYSDPPYCSTKCSQGSWGINCSQLCSSNCLNNICNATGASCNQGCKAGYQLPDCTKECLSGYWGINCSTKCNDNCYNGECNSINGTCIFGCKEGFQFPNCTTSCVNGSYGRNCSMHCSTNCIDQICDAVNGYCKCQTGYESNTCDIKSAISSSAPIGEIVGPVLAAVVVIIVIIIVVIFLRRKKSHAKKLSTTVASGQHNFAFGSIHNETIITTTEKKDNNEAKYYSIVPEEESTLIAIESLNSYINSRGVNFYSKQFENIPVVKNVTQEVGLRKENKIKNRYKNICPYDHSRVHLEINSERKEMDYINASYILGCDDKVQFIAAQGPQKSTLADFIRMLWEQKSDVVVMLTDLIEGNKVKCEQYWPDSDKKQVDYIKVKLGSTQVFADFTIRKLELSKKGEATHIFTQFHFTSWPDKGVPSTQWSLVDVEQRVTAIDTNKPIVVHCSAGVGRTGTFIALYNIMRQAEETGCVDFFKTVSKLREDRIFMVQTVSQYEFLHNAAQVAIACMRTTLSIHDFTDRLKVLEEKNALGRSKMETEFKGLCAILEKPETKLEEELNVYENADKSKASGDYEQYQLEKIPEKNSFVLLPGYKQRDQHILAKLPTTTSEAVDFWNLVLKYNTTLIVSFNPDISEKKSMNYLPTSVDEPLILPSIEIKLKKSNQKKLWLEQKLNFQSQKTANVSSDPKSHADNITLLKGLSIELDTKTALEVLKKARQCHSQTGGIIVYMCSDGVSQSGFMAVLSLLLDRVDNESLLSIPLTVGTIKSLQPKIIANLDQYQKLYHTVSRHVDTSTQYSNMDLTYYQNADKLNLARNASRPTAGSRNKSPTPKGSPVEQKDDKLLYANYV